MWNSSSGKRFSARSEGCRHSLEATHNPKVVGSNPTPATTDIDSPTFEVDVVLNRRGFLILSKSPSADVNAWEFTGNQCGNRVGIWERDRNSLRVMTSGGAVAPSVSPVPMT